MQNRPAADSGSFKDFEYRGWEQAVLQYDQSFSRLTAQMIPHLLDGVGVSSGKSFLDIACGPGFAAKAAQDRGALVTAIDFSDAMLEKARKNHPSIDFSKGDAEQLAFAANSFDTAVMNFGLLHLEQPQRALAEVYAVLRPGGRFAFTVWASPAAAVGFAVVLKAIENNGGLEVSLPAGPPFFKYSDTNVGCQELAEAGFIEVVATTIPLTWRLESAEEFFQAFYVGTARTGGLLRAQPAERLQAIKAEIVSTARERFGTDNGLEIEMPSVIYTAQRSL